MSIDNDDETKVNLSESVINLINLENILDSNSDLALPNVKEEAVKQQSTLLTLKKPSPSNKKKKRKKSKSRSPENRMDPDDEKAESVQRENKVHVCLLMSYVSFFIVINLNGKSMLIYE